MTPSTHCTPAADSNLIDANQTAPVPSPQARASAPLLLFLALHVGNPQIVKPDTRESLLQLHLQLSQYPGFPAAVAALDPAERRGALKALFALFGEETWVGVSGAMLRMLNEARIAYPHPHP